MELKLKDIDMVDMLASTAYGVTAALLVIFFVGVVVFAGMSLISGTEISAMPAYLFG